MNAQRILPRRLCLVAVCTLEAILVLAGQSSAATRYFDVNGTTTGSGVGASGSYSWEGNFWNANNTAGTGATTAWTESDTPIFSAGSDGSGLTYTITASSNHTISGIQLNATSGANVNVNSTSGVVLSLPAGDQVFSVGTPTSQNLNINAVLGGSGRLKWNGTGSLYLLGNNTFTGGLLFNASSGVNFINNNSFGTGTMTWGVASQILAAPTAATPLTVGNPMVTRSASTLIMATFAKPVNFSGPWTLASGTSTLDVRSTTDATISGIISGTDGTSALTKIQTGKLTLSGANTYGGGTTISAGTLEVSGASGRIGTGNVSASVTGTALAIDSGVTDAIGNSAQLSLANGALLNLGGGVNERVGTLSLDTAFQPAGTYGSSQSNAVNKLDMYFTGTGILTVGPPILAGDYNNDGVVDAADYITWRANVGQPSQSLPNDTTGVIIGDPQYDLWRSNFGNTVPVPGAGASFESGAVPEPRAFGMLMVALMALLLVATRGGMLRNGYSRQL